MFEPPFWVVLFERIDEKQYAVAREVIGTSEPTNTELMLFLDTLDCNRLQYTIPVENGKPQKNKISFKKMQREAKKATEQSDYKHTYTKAHEELKKQQQLKKQEMKSLAGKERNEKEEQKFELRQQKKKEKLRGH
jgi:hypothetical protein